VRDDKSATSIVTADQSLEERPIVVHGPVHGGGPGEPSGFERGLLPAPQTDVAGRRLLGDAAGSAVPDGGPSPADVGVAPPGDPVAEPRRAHSLDALRGLFLISMTLGFTIHGSYFPDWMYHRQFPPPGNLVDIAGITWRDLAYAAFLFTMAAALPITLSRRIERGETEVAIMLAAIRRFFMLFVFALLIGHSNTFFIGYTQEGRALAIAGFFIMFLIFTRRRRDWDERKFALVNRAGWIAAILFLALSPLVYDGTFTPTRRDDIIAGLAFAALAGSIVWYFTRENLNARLVVLAATLALYLGAHGEGWIQSFWWSSPAPWLFQPSQLTLLAVVIPGTIAGDVLLRWMRSPAPPPGGTAGPGWGTSRITLLAMLSLAIAPLVVVGLYNRWVQETTQIAIALCALGAVLTWRPTSSTELLLHRLFSWGALWLLLGLVLDPFEGGIKKVPDTLSYFFTVTGITMMVMVALVAMVDVLGLRKTVRPLIDVGHNPMLVYVLYTVFLNSLLEMMPAMRGALRGSPGESILRSLVSTVVVVLIVQYFTRKRIFWRT
jgi:predicted acyltransferase